MAQLRNPHPIGGQNYQAVVLVDPVTGEGYAASGGGGGGGDASAANQLAQLAELEAIAARLPTSLGAKPSEQSLSVVPAEDVFILGSPASALDTNLLTGVVGDWVDARGFTSVSFQIAGSAGITAGQVAFEQTQDLSLPAVPLFMRFTNANTAPSSVYTVPAFGNAIFEANLNARFVRVRINTAIVGGTATAAAVLSQTPVSGTVGITGSANIIVTQTTPASLQGRMEVAAPGFTADVASSAITTTANSSAITPASGVGYEVNIPVTAVSGTNPALDVVVQESDDSGVNWYDVYQFPRIFSTGSYRSPRLTLVGNRVRYVQTVSGTSPSFTRAINRVALMDVVSPVRQRIDRTLAIGTLGAQTASLGTQAGMTRAQAVLRLAAGGTTMPAIKLIGSDDNGASWYDLGAPVTGIANGNAVASYDGPMPALLRAEVSTAGVGATLTTLTLKGQ